MSGAEPAPALPKVLEVLRAARSSARAEGVDLIGVTGSVARGDARPGSDVDVVYSIVGRPTLFTLGGLLMDLRDELGCDVDLIDLNQVKPRVRTEMERDLVPI